MMTMIYSVSLNVSNSSVLFTTDKQWNTTRDNSTHRPLQLVLWRALVSNDTRSPCCLNCVIRLLHVQWQPDNADVRCVCRADKTQSMRWMWWRHKQTLWRHRQRSDEVFRFHPLFVLRLINWHAPDTTRLGNKQLALGSTDDHVAWVCHSFDVDVIVEWTKCVGVECPDDLWGNNVHYVV